MHTAWYGLADHRNANESQGNLAMLHIDFPLSIDKAGRTSRTSWANHALDMVIQLLLTREGERVNRPDFGTPLPRIVFEGNDQELADVVQFTANAALQRWLGDSIQVVELSVQPYDSYLEVELKYRLKGETQIRETTPPRRLPRTGVAAQ